MKTILSFIIFTISSVAWSNAFTVKFMELKQEGLLIEVSSSCKKNMKCMALKSFKKLNKLNYAKVHKDIYGGKSAGDVICSNVFNAKFKYIRDKNQNEDTLCLFSDGSYISTAFYDLKISYFKEE